jgi:hypothetical protein
VEMDRLRLLLDEHQSILEMFATGNSLEPRLMAITGSISRLEPRAVRSFLLLDLTSQTFTQAFSADVPSSFGDANRGVLVLRDGNRNLRCGGLQRRTGNQWTYRER